MDRKLFALAAFAAVLAMPARSDADAAPGFLGGRVFCDANGNGVDDSEPGVEGVVVQIENNDFGFVTVSTVTTDVDGFWKFDMTDHGGDFYVSVPTGQGALAGGTATTNSPLFFSRQGDDAPDMDFGFSGVCEVAKQVLAGRVYCDRGRDDSGASDPGIADVVVRIKLGTSTFDVLTDANGAWTFEAPSAGDYSVSIPGAQSVLSASPHTAPTSLLVALATGQSVGGIDFGFFGACAGWNFSSYTQGGWGAPPNGGNPGAILKANFSRVFPNGITVGGKYTMKFTCAAAVEAFLPAGSTPGKLCKSLSNPTSSPAGVFGGQVLALKINVAMGGIVTPAGFGALVLHDTGTSLDGKTVAQVLAAAETALGGGSPPTGFSVSTLNDLVSTLNGAFDNGVATQWAVDHLF